MRQLCGDSVSASSILITVTQTILKKKRSTNKVILVILQLEDILQRLIHYASRHTLLKLLLCVPDQPRLAITTPLKQSSCFLKEFLMWPKETNGQLTGGRKTKYLVGAKEKQNISGWRLCHRFTDYSNLFGTLLSGGY